jgi:hypothetical protein
MVVDLLLGSGKYGLRHVRPRLIQEWQDRTICPPRLARGGMAHGNKLHQAFLMRYLSS